MTFFPASMAAVKATSAPPELPFLKVISEDRSLFSNGLPSAFLTGSSNVIVGVTVTAISTAELAGLNIGTGGKTSAGVTFAQLVATLNSSNSM